MVKTTDGMEFNANDLDGYMRDGKVFSASTNFITISGTTEAPLLLVKNPSGSGHNMQTSLLTFSADTNSARALFKFYVAPTITANGTTVTIGNNYIGHSSASVMEVYSQPTISANGTFITALLLGSSQSTLLVPRSIIVPANINILATVQNSQNNTPIAVSIQWKEFLS